MKFKDLSINTLFEFDHAKLPLCHGLAHGPWIKISARKYEHAESGMKCKVGTINTRVVNMYSDMKNYPKHCINYWNEDI